MSNIVEKPPAVSLLSPDDPQYRVVADQFLNDWIHPDKPVPSIHNILLLDPITDHVDTHLNYWGEVKARRSSDGNIQYQFHGTNRTCELGDNNQELDLCSESSCRLCSILRTSFDISPPGFERKFKRFGRGIYISSASSKADSYSDTNMPPRPYHAMILAQVVVGQTKQLYDDDTSLTEPPQGYDSVTGMPSMNRLNYPETVVYRREAISPFAVIIYGRSPSISGSLANFVTGATLLQPQLGAGQLAPVAGGRRLSKKLPTDGQLAPVAARRRLSKLPPEVAPVAARQKLRKKPLANPIITV